MTLVPMKKKCPKCKRKYSWNPDVGRMSCPYCGFFSISGGDDIPFKKKK